MVIEREDGTFYVAESINRLENKLKNKIKVYVVPSADNGHTSIEVKVELMKYSEENWRLAYDTFCNTYALKQYTTEGKDTHMSLVYIDGIMPESEKQRFKKEYSAIVEVYKYMVEMNMLF